MITAYSYKPRDTILELRLDKKWFPILPSEIL